MRTVTIGEEIWFVGKDVAEILGYKNSRNALINHVSGEDKRIIQRSEIATLERMKGVRMMEEKSITLISAELMFYAGLQASIMKDDENIEYANETMEALYIKLPKADKERFKKFVADVGIANGVTENEIIGMIDLIDLNVNAKMRERSGNVWDDLLKNVL